MTLLIHIGYHKTGSSWLQQRLFDRQDLGFRRPLDWKQIQTSFIRADPFAFVPSAQNADAVRRCEEEGTIPVLSYERLSGNPHSGGYDSAGIANLLAKTFIDAKILIIIREQQSMIRSVYKQYVRAGGVATLGRYLHPVGTARVPLFDFAFFEYHRLIALYQRLFGETEVLVLPFEALRRDAYRFASSICTFVGLPNVDRLDLTEVNPGYSASLIRARRYYNAVCFRDSLNPAAPFRWAKGAQAFEVVSRLVPKRFSSDAEARLAVRIGREVQSRYVESNSITAQLTGLDLASLGYSVQE